jgi:hypothetical protein
MTKNKKKDHVYSYTFLVSSSHDIVYRPNSKYAAHFIFPTTKNWLDFELNTTEEVEYLVKPVREGYHVTIFTKETNLKFKSFGGLNTNFATSTFTTYVNEVTVTAINSFNNSIIDFNITEPTILTSNSGTITFNWSNDPFNITINADGHISITNLTDLHYENYTANFSLFGSAAQIKCYNNVSLNYLTVFSVNVSDGTTINSYSTGNGTVYLELMNATDYNVSIYKTGYADSNRTLNTTSTSENFTFYLMPLNVTLLYFKDEQTLEDILNVSLDLISDNFSQNYTTNTGIITISGLDVGEYQARYSSTGYMNRDYYFNVTSTNFFTTTLYLLNNTAGDNITITVLDENDNWLEDYYFRLQRYYLDINGYRTVEVVKTDHFGQEQISAEVLGEYYRVIITDGVSTYLQSERFKFKQSDMTFPIYTGITIGNNFEQTGNVVHQLDYDNNTYSFVFTYDDLTGTATQGCLEIFRESLAESTQLNNTCVSAASGIITVAVDNSTEATYSAKGFVYFSTDKRPISQRVETINNNDLATWGTIGLLLTFIIVIAIAFVGIWNPSVMVILEGLALTFTRTLGFHSINWGLLIAIDILCIIIAFMISKKS